MVCLVSDNINLVDYILKRTYISDRWDRDEIRSAGVEGLIRAAKTFDLKRGGTFSTLACLCIQRAMWQSAAREERFYKTYMMVEELRTTTDKEVIDYDWEKLIKRLTSNEKQYLRRRLLGFKDIDIARMDGVTRQRCGYLFNNIKRKACLESVT